MEESREKVQKKLNFLFGQVTQGLIYFYCSRSLHKAFRDNILVKSSYFFNGVYEASNREAVLALSRLMIEHKDSITVHHLFNYAENEPHLFSRTPEDVRQAVGEHKKRLEKYETLIECVKEQRDRVLTHLDRKHVNDPSTLFAHPQGVNLTELGECIREILEILNFYANYYGMGFDPTNLEEAIAGDVDIILKWMKEYGRPEEWIRPPVF